MEEEQLWFAMREQHRGLSKQYMYEHLAAQGIETYTPIVKKSKIVKGHAVIVEMPYIRDLFFIHATLSQVKAIMTPYCHFQFRYRTGVSPATPIVVPKKEMDDFISVNQNSDSPGFISPDSIPADVRNRKIRVVGGPLDGVQGMLKTVRGSKFKTLYVELPGIMAVSAVSQFDFIQFED